MWSFSFRWRRSRQNLASALIGEISAAIDLLEKCPEVREMCNIRDGAGAADESFHFALPKPVVYEGNAARLTAFDSPLPRELSYFYAELSAIPERLRRAMVSTQDRELRKALAAQAMEEIDRVESLGDQLLRDLRPFVSRARPASISRA